METKGPSRARNIVEAARRLADDPLFQASLNPAAARYHAKILEACHFLAQLTGETEEDVLRNVVLYIRAAPGVLGIGDVLSSWYGRAEAQCNAAQPVNKTADYLKEWSPRDIVEQMSLPLYRALHMNGPFPDEDEDE